jgi:hypothetical protein
MQAVWAKRMRRQDEEILSWLRSHEFTKKEAEDVIEMARIEEGGARTL